MSDCNREWRKRNPEKVRAHITVQTAMRRGVLVRQPCEDCGAEKTHAHHDDYSKPLDVRWLCQSCHHAHHSALRPPRKSRVSVAGRAAAIAQHLNDCRDKARTMRNAGATYPEIAATFGITKGTAFKWVNRPLYK
jgi:transposase-like protein